jgi:hypothetical protein
MRADFGVEPVQVGSDLPVRRRARKRALEPLARLSGGSGEPCRIGQFSGDRDQRLTGFRRGESPQSEDEFPVLRASEASAASTGRLAGSLSSHSQRRFRPSSTWPMVTKISDK